MKLLLASLLLVSAAAAADLPLATVDGAPIMPKDLRYHLQEQEDLLRSEFPVEPDKRENGLEEKKRTALDVLIDEQLLINEFRRLGGIIKPEFVDEEVEDAIKHQFMGDREALLADLTRKGWSMAEFRSRCTRKFKIKMTRQRIAGDVEISDAEARACFERLRPGLSRPCYVKLQSVTILKQTPDARRAAEELRSRIASGADFATIARASSKDSQAEVGGESEWMPLSEVEDDVGNVVARLKPGELSSVIEQPTYFLILRLAERRSMVEPDFDTHKEYFEDMAQMEKILRLAEDEVRRMRQKADIRKMQEP